MLMKRLSLIDSLKFSAVCTSWRRASSKWCQRATLFPWILKRVRSVDSATALCSLYSPSEDSVYNFTFSKATADPSYYMMFVGCIDGYLIMSEHKWRKSPSAYGWSINYLLNLITGARIMLPPSNEVPMISAASSNPRSSGCIVATILTPRTYKLAFCRPGDKSWTYQSGPKYRIHFHELQFHKDGKLYAFANGGYGVQYLVVFDPLEVFSKAESQIYVGKQFEVGSLIERHKNLYGLETYPYFMITSEGEILLIWDRYFGSAKYPDRYLQNPDAPFGVFKLDVGSEPELTETTLEDQTIFISANSFSRLNRDISIPLSKLTSSVSTVLKDKAFNGLGGGNCIYYATNTTGHLLIGIYNLADGKTDYFSANNYIDGNNDARERVNGQSWFPIVS
uniref:uncharacterized protein LOC105352524 n=1 Tax=Fragaria vesca subsp. vesca TaxID=101020 RepID=UPI0005C834F3|nr:PREDICTED: uncharacterized protein LOC105352524 [Fragaria vesca subsp. vesca]